MIKAEFKHQAGDKTFVL